MSAQDGVVALAPAAYDKKEILAALDEARALVESGDYHTVAVALVGPCKHFLTHSYVSDMSRLVGVLEMLKLHCALERK